MYLAALQRGYIIQREKEKKKTSYLQGLRLKSPYKATDPNLHKLGLSIIVRRRLIWLLQSPKVLIGKLP